MSGGEDYFIGGDSDSEVTIEASTSQRPQITVRMEFPESWMFDNIERYRICCTSCPDCSSCILLIVNLGIS